MNNEESIRDFIESIPDDMLWILSRSDMFRTEEELAKKRDFCKQHHVQIGNSIKEEKNYND